MYAFDRIKYARLLEFSRSSRFWCRLWLDGLHQGTHFHWRLSPLSLVGLARTWRHFAGLNDWSYQRDAIIRMARRRLGTSAHSLPTPSSSEFIAWKSFFEHVLGAEDEIRTSVLRWHRSRIEESRLDAEGPDRLWIHLNDLAAALTLYGYSTDELFNRAKDYVIDASAHQSGTSQDRLLKYLDYFLSPERRTYVVWTSVVADTPWLSTTLRKRFSTLTLDAPWQIGGARPVRAYLRRDGQEVPVIISLVDGTHGVSQRHRFAALQELDALMSHAKPLGHLKLEARTYMVLSTSPAKAPWFYSRRPYAIPLLEGTKANADAKRLAGSAQQLFDDPVSVIDDAFQIFEHTGMKTFWNIVPPAYHRLLRRDLGFSILAYRRRLEGVYSKVPQDQIPQGAQLVADVAGIPDHVALLEMLCSKAPDEDPAFQHRLAEVVVWTHFQAGRTPQQMIYNTVHEFADLLTIARGFRNALHHSKLLTLDVYPIALYLAIGLLYAYSACTR